MERMWINQVGLFTGVAGAVGGALAHHLAAPALTSREVVGLFPEQARFAFVPVLVHHRGCLAARN